MNENSDQRLMFNVDGSLLVIDYLSFMTTVRRSTAILDWLVHLFPHYDNLALLLLPV